MKVKYLATGLLLFAASHNTFAQQSESEYKAPKSLFSDDFGKSLKPSFGIVDLNYTHTSLFGEDLPGFGMNLGVVLGDHWLTGLSFQGSTTSNLSMGSPDIALVNPRYNYFFMGLNNALLIAPYSLINVSIPLRVGLGGVTYVDRFQQGVLNTGRVDQDYFLVVEPGLDITINLSKHVGITTGASYRFVEGVQNAGANSDFNGFFFNAGLRFRLGG